MTPWTILGWLLVAAIAIPAIVMFAALFNGTADWFHARLKYFRTRKVPPQEGQRWDQTGRTLKIMRIYDDGGIRIEIGSSSWGESPEDWKQRVRNHKLFLTYQPKDK